MKVLDPSEFHATFARAFNACDREVLAELFEPDAVFVTEPGNVIAGEERRRSLEDFLALELPMDLTPRHTYAAGDLALLISDYRIAGTGPDGEEVLHEGTSADVVRRGDDGGWRLVIDNPPGTTTA